MSALRLCDWCEREMPRNQGGYTYVSRDPFPYPVRIVPPSDLFLCFECDMARREARDQRKSQQFEGP